MSLLGSKNNTEKFTSQMGTLMIRLSICQLIHEAQNEYK